MDCDHPLISTPQDRILLRVQQDDTAYRLWIDSDSVLAVQYYGNTNYAFNLSAHAEADGVDNVPSYAYSQGFHGGIDLVADPGTPVYAGVYGIVEYVDHRAYEPRYVKIKVAPDTYIIIGHLSSEGIAIEAGQIVNPNTPIGVVSEAGEHVHIEYWDESSNNTILRLPYDFMLHDVQMQFFNVAMQMDENDPRITFHQRDDHQWQTRNDQPPLIYHGLNLNVGQPNYINPWN